MNRPLEKVVQRQVSALFSAVGGVVRSNSQYRASGVSLGFPDLHVSVPKAGVWFWWETKRPQAKGFDFLKPETWVPEPLRPSQIVFMTDCWRTGQPYYWGGVREAEQALIALGLAHQVGGVVTLGKVA